MPQTDPMASGWGFARRARCRCRFALASAGVLVLAVVSAGGAARAASAGSGDADRAGCALRLGAANARGIVEVRADCRWPVHPERVIEIVRNQDDIDAVLSSVSESTRLADGRVVQVHTLGWAFAERQVTLDFRGVALPDGGQRIEFRPAREQQRLREGAVQVADDHGWWEVHPDGAGGTHLRYEVRYDAGGNLQPWIAQRFQKAGVARSLAEVRLAAERAARQALTPPVSAEPGR